MERRELEDGSRRTVLVDGSMVGGYRVSFLAAGGMSVAYRGEKLGKTVVLKEVATTNTLDVPALISEKTLVERLSHPGIVSYVSFLCENGYYYLVLEYVPGEALSRFLDGAPPAVEEVAEWAVQLCDIFAYLHRQQPPIIYRDLKPENVMLNDGKVKLIDFGIARVHKGDAREKDTILMGSRMTASPEHYGGAQTDARSDIYTLGATIYELLTGGKRKQVGAFAFAPVSQLRPEVPAALEAAVMKALEIKPIDRFSNALEFADAILAAMGKPPRSTAPAERATPAPSSGGTTRPGQGRGFKLVLAGILLVGLGAGLALQQGYLVPQPPPSIYPESTGVQEASLKGDLFGASEVAGQPVVMMGEDVGLFQVSAWEKESAEQRAQTLAARLNRFYQSACLTCGGSNLESPDIRVGRFTETGDIVIFYAHIHGNDPPSHGPEVLATVDEAQAKALGQPARLVAYYWRDIVRDVVDLSRALPVQNSALGTELQQALEKARGRLDPQGQSMENLRQILRQASGAQALTWRERFLEIPDRQPSFDAFSNVKGYEPLRD